MELTNNNNISLPMAVWLAHSDYTNTNDKAPEGELVSVTTLLKPVRQFVLTNRIPMDERENDVSDFIASRLGHAIHDSIERTWRYNYKSAMTKLGYSQSVIDRIVINPETVEPEQIPVYLEQREFKEFDGVVISGQFDMVFNGELQDNKSTSVYSYISGSKDEDYRLQLSIYRWLNPKKVTSDIARIQFVFTDWQRSMSLSRSDYPKQRVVEKTFDLLSMEEVETWIRNRLAAIRANVKRKESDIIRCTDKELWRSKPTFKYYKDPSKANSGGRATRVFGSSAEAHNYMATTGKGKGVVVHVKGEVKACGYCPAFAICSQKDEYATKS